MISLVKNQSNLSDDLIHIVGTLLEMKGVKPEDFNGNMLDMRDFSLYQKNDKYRLELLLDGYPICYLNETIAIDERGMQTSIDYLIETQLNTLCKALDTLSEF